MQPSTNNQEKFSYLRQIVSEHLGRKAKEVFQTKYPPVTNPVLPSVQTALDKLKSYCVQMNISYESRTKVVVDIPAPRRWTDTPDPHPADPDSEHSMRKNTSVSTACTDRHEESTIFPLEDPLPPLPSPQTAIWEDLPQSVCMEDRLILDRLVRRLREEQNREDRVIDIEREETIQGVKALIESYIRLAKEPPEIATQSEATLNIGQESLNKASGQISTVRSPYGLFRPGGYVVGSRAMQAFRNKLFSHDPQSKNP